MMIHYITSTIYTEAVGYASHSLETIFTTPFKTTCLVQLLYRLQQYYLILSITDFSNLLAFRQMEQTNVPFLNFRWTTKVLMPLT
jgi:hypothetical protein